MRFDLRFSVHQAGTMPPSVPVHYQHALSAIIYKMIAAEDPEFATTLHDIGYGNKRFKLFTFSDLRTNFIITHNCLLLRSNNAELTVCFHMSDAADRFIAGLLKERRFVLGDNSSNASFVLKTVNNIDDIPQHDRNGNVAATLYPISPLAVGYKPDGRTYYYISPRDPDFLEVLIEKWLAKYQVAYGVSARDISSIKERISARVIFSGSLEKRWFSLSLRKESLGKQSLYGLGFKNFHLQVCVPKDLLAIAINAGLGLHTSQGFGCMAISKESAPRVERQPVIAKTRSW